MKFMKFLKLKLRCLTIDAYLEFEKVRLSGVSLKIGRTGPSGTAGGLAFYGGPPPFHGGYGTPAPYMIYGGQTTPLGDYVGSACPQGDCCKLRRWVSVQRL